MVVGLLRITLHVPQAHSLKERRAVVRRAVDRVRAKYNVAIAEVGDLERWQVATVAIAAVSNDRAHVNEVLDRVTSTLASASAGSAEIMQREMEIQTYGDREPLGGGPSFVRGRGSKATRVGAAQATDATTQPEHSSEDDDDGDDE